MPVLASAQADADAHAEATTLAAAPSIEVGANIGPIAPASTPAVAPAPPSAPLPQAVEVTPATTSDGPPQVAPAAQTPGQTPSQDAAGTAAPSAPEAAALDATATGNLWDRIRRGFQMPDLTGPLVRRNEQFYASKPDYVQRMTDRASRYLFHIVEEIERRGMPTEIALLPFIESAFNPEALSSAKASGMWQFIPGTGKLYGLKQNMFRDERRDVLESTRAALDYLSKLHDQFGDWQLALAAYNWGEGGVQRAIDANRRRGKPTDYESLKMPRETRNYVPKLQAVKNIIANPEQFRLDLPDVGNQQYFTTVTRTRDIDVDTAAKFAGMSVEEFRALNPSFNKPVIVGAMAPAIVLPRDKADRFVASVDLAQGSLSSYTTHVVGVRENVDTIAKQYGLSATALRDINGIPNGARLKSGATVLVPKPEGVGGDIPEDVAENAVLSYDQVKRISVRVRKGDSFASVARRYGVTPAQLAQWNGLPTNASVQAGQTLVVQRVVSSKQAHSTRKLAAHGHKKVAKAAAHPREPKRVADNSGGR